MYQSADLSNVESNLATLGYTVKTFASKEEAAEYLTTTLHGKTIGLGGSVTIGKMGL